jgi:hypothetical protein
MKTLVCKNEVAVANNSGAMESETIKKNGISSKNQMNRGHFSKNLLFLVVITCVVLSSCMSTQKVLSVKTVDISHGGVIQKPVIADLSVSQTKVIGTASGSSSTNVDILKNEAVKDALSKAGNADVLIEPNFTISKRYSSIEVEVTGFPGTYKNFRTIEDGDATWLKNMEGIHQVTVYDAINKQTVVTEKKSNKGGVWAGVGGGLLLIILIIAAL